MTTKCLHSRQLFFAIILCSIISFIAPNFILPQNSSVQHTSWSYNVPIYEVNLRQFTEEGTIKAFEKHLPRLKELGVGILWFMPINPIGELNRKGSLGSYYSVKDYKALNSEFGTLEDFKSLVKKIHDMGMYVIIDWVANHSAWDNVWKERHPEFYNKNEGGNYLPPEGTDWSDVIDFNYDNKLLWEYMLDALRYWIIECDIDGYRCDVAAMLPIEFWNYARPELEKLKPVFMLAEAHEVELHEKAFDMTYNWELKDIMNRIAQEKNEAKDLYAHIEEEKTQYPADAFRMTFTSNHDENTWSGTEFERLGDAAEVFAVLSATLKGMPLVYSGQEAGWTKRIRFFDKDTIIWTDSKFAKLYTELFKLKKKNKALLNGCAGGNVIPIHVENNSVFAFFRERDGDKILVIMNLSPEANKFVIEDKNIEGVYHLFGTNESISHSSKEIFKMDPWSYKILYRLTDR
ncbi:MAG: alpha-amylase family glycosyl hydrolase [bacterium]